jgi:hypothetical protein
MAGMRDRLIHDYNPDVQLLLADLRRWCGPAVAREPEGHADR